MTQIKHLLLDGEASYQLMMFVVAMANTLLCLFVLGLSIIGLYRHKFMTGRSCKPLILPGMTVVPLLCLQLARLTLPGYVETSINSLLQQAIFLMMLISIGIFSHKYTQIRERHGVIESGSS